MKPFYVLLWKEMREQRFKLLIGLAACLGISILRLHSGFNSQFTAGLESWAPGFFLAIVVLLGMDVVAGERASRTLPFLLGKPVSAGRLMLPKVLVGVAGLLLVMTAFWAGVYTVPLTQTPTDFNPDVWAIEHVGLLHMTLIWFLPFCAAYLLTVLASSLTDSPVKSACWALLLICAAGLTLKHVTNLHPSLTDYIPMFTQFDDTGRVVRVAEEGWYLLTGIGLVAILCACWAMASTGLSRLKERTLGWGAIVFVWMMAVGFLWSEAWAGWGSTSDGNRSVDPVGIFEYDGDSESGHPWTIALRDDWLFVSARNGLSVVDVSVPNEPEEATTLEISGWDTRSIAASESTVFLFGVRYGFVGEGAKRAVWTDSVGVLAIDVSDPRKPELIRELPFESKEYWNTPFVFTAIDERVFVAVKNKGGFGGKLFSFDVREPESPLVAGVLSFEDVQVNGTIQIAGQHAYAETDVGVQIWDLTDPTDMKEIARLDLDLAFKSRDFQYIRRERAIAVEGDRLYVQRLWPRELAVIDISDVHDPKEIGYYVGGGLYNSRGLWAELEARDGRLYERGNAHRSRNLIEYELGDDVRLTPGRRFAQPRDGGDDGGNFVISGEHIHARFANSLVIFRR